MMGDMAGLTVNLFDETGELGDNLGGIVAEAAKMTFLNGAAASTGSANSQASYSVDILIVDIDNMREINRDTRGIDAPTDVLSFPSGELFEDGCNPFHTLGDIVIAYEKIFSQSSDYGHSLEREAAFLTVHAMLHLFGYDHKNTADEERMFGLQEEILNEMGLKR